MPLTLRTSRSTLRIGSKRPKGKSEPKKTALQNAKMDSTQLESLIKENTKRQWVMYEKMSHDAIPLLRSTKIDDIMRAKATHFMGRRDMTANCIARRNRDYNTLPDAFAQDQTYAVNLGMPWNTRDEHMIYHVDYDGKYLPFQCAWIGNETVKVAKIPGIEAEPRYQQRYLSLYQSTVSKNLQRKMHIQEMLTNHATGDADIATKIMNALDTMDTDKTELVYDDSDIYHAYTSDYTVFVSTIQARQNINPLFALKIRRRIVIASQNYNADKNKPVNIPLAEEIIINVMSIRNGYVGSNKDTPYQSNVVSLILNINLVCDEFQSSEVGMHFFKRKPKPGQTDVRTDALRPSTTPAAAAPLAAEPAAPRPDPAAQSMYTTVPALFVLPESDTNISTVHFFGQNAFSMSLSDLTPSDKFHFATSHETGMYVAGWLIRQLDLAAYGNQPALFRALERAALSDGTKLETYFTRQQKAGEFIRTEHGKYFHTKMWLASPTLVVIAISPLKDNTKTIVIVWTVGRHIPSDNANRVFATQSLVEGVRQAGEASVAGPEDVRVEFPAAKMPSLVRSNPLAPRLGARFRSSLPMDLELELQSL